MEVKLAYGTDGIWVDVPDGRTTVITPDHPPAAPDPMQALRAALRTPVGGPPLRERVRRGQTVAISACDGTRPQPRELMIPAILDELDGVIAPDDIVVLVATGTHRGNSPAELRVMFGDAVDRVRIVNHDARAADSLRWIGRFGDNVPVWLNREWAEADVRITTGFVEPHFFAGFSGGPKLVAPGLAALETVLTLHDARRIGHPKAVWGITRGNPVHDDVRAIAAGTGVDFGLDVVLDRNQRIVSAFGGDLLDMHGAATDVARRVSMRPVTGRFDVVITTNAGFPLDQNLYQAVKGMSAAHQVVRPGGTIICAAECRDGFPDHGSYREVLTSQSSPQALMAEIEARTHTVPDQWQVQIQARIQATARVVMHTSYLSDEELAAAHLEQTADIGEFVRRLDSAASICVLPEGPQTIPYVVGRSRVHQAWPVEP
ncbi:nickel-dependent lactate racemase [Dactylosporangium sp. CA-092794]|uniref:nickel-dependent lactate racemase n=1 Tax=Dactylosporangium sp. CA-092794 TaxID=3239929 RepID=UPI003D90339C